MNQQIRFRDLFKGRAERLDQMMGQPADEADRIGQQEGLLVRQRDSSDRCLQGGEQHVARQYMLIRSGTAVIHNGVEQAGLAGVRIPDEADDGDFILPALLALDLAPRHEPFELLLQRGDPVQ
ncbi:hypothetical protein D3C73_1171120 [compost metagenome]